MSTDSKRRPKRSQILLGYEAGTGEPVYIPLHHLVVTGTTQLSGKTTTLEALISRSEMTSVAFRTKRGEGSFRLANAHVHEPFFRERADWQYVQSLLEATMRERMRFERSWIIDAAKGATSLAGVLENVNTQLETAKGLSKSVLTTLKAYLEIVVPEIEAVRFARMLNLAAGRLNVMDLIGLRDEVQSLVIASTLEELHETATGVVVVIPEAWKFVPEGRATPVKYPLEAIARQGAGVGVYVFLDSQDITGVDKAILKNVDTWLIGRQREKNEVERAIAQLPLPKGKRPKPEEIMRLKVGHFIVASRDEVREVYVQPAWLDAGLAQKIAKSGLVDLAQTRAPAKQTEDYVVNSRDDLVESLTHRLQEARAEIEKLRDELREWRRLAPAGESKKRQSNGTAAATPSTPSNGEQVRHELDVEVLTPTLRVSERVVHLKATSDDNRGRLAILFDEGFFDAPKSVNAACREFAARGWGTWSGGAGATNMGRALGDFTTLGFLRHEGKDYVARQESKDRIERVQGRE